MKGHHKYYRYYEDGQYIRHSGADYDLSNAINQITTLGYEDHSANLKEYDGRMYKFNPFTQKYEAYSGCNYIVVLQTNCNKRNKKCILDVYVSFFCLGRKLSTYRLHPKTRRYINSGDFGYIECMPDTPSTIPLAKNCIAIKIHGISKHFYIMMDQVDCIFLDKGARE